MVKLLNYFFCKSQADLYLTVLERFMLLVVTYL